MEHAGILAAIAVIGGGLQMVMLIGWYLHHAASTGRPAKVDKEPRLD
jgi:hypothetical protein